MMTSKTPCLRSLWTNYGIKVMECFIFAETLYSFTNLMVKYPIRSLITKVSKLLPYSATAQMDSSFIWFWIISTIRSTFLHYKFLFLVICQNIYNWTIGLIIHLVLNYNLDYWIHHSFSSGLFQPSGAIHEGLKNGCVHYDTTTCYIQEIWFTWLTVFLYDKIWKTTFKLPESLLFPALT